MRRGFVVGVVVGMVTAGMVAVAHAAIPDGQGVVHACFKRVNSASKPVKLLNTSQNTKCPSGWSAVQWNQTGQPGAPGAPGTPGAPGVDGVSGYSVATQTFDVTALGSDTATADASCPAGTVPIGGGYTDGSGNGGGNFGAFSTLVNGPLFNRNVNDAITGGGWRVYLKSASGFGTDATFTVYAICASMN